MEYVFRNSVAESPSTAILGQFSMTLKHGDLERTISYAAITSVQLYKKAGLFFILLSPESGEQVKISNRFYHSPEQFDDYSNAYTSFIRILHHHLKDKSKAKYKCGVKSYRFLISILVLVGLSFGTALCLELAKIHFVNEWIQMAVIFLIFSMVYLLLVKNNFPRSYQPEDVPLRFLPQHNMFN